MYDQRYGRPLTEDDLPDGVSIRLLAVFLKVHDLSFHAREVYAGPGLVQGWQKDPEKFRVSTHTYPARGVNISFGRLEEWMAQVENMNPRMARHQLAKMKGCLVKLEASGLTAGINSLQGAIFQTETEIEQIEEAQAAMKEIADVRA